MAPITETPPVPRRRGRPRKYPIADSEPPRKKLRYGASEGSEYGEYGRGTSTERGGHGAARSAPRARSSRRPSEMARSNPSPARTASHSHAHDESPHRRYDSTVAAASAMSHNDSYKPREERGWEEFHSELDIDAKLTVFTAEEVDGPRNDLGTGSPTQQLLSAQFSGSPILGQALQMLRQQAENAHANGNPAFVFTPIKRRPGRPPKRPEALLMYELGLNSPLQHITPAPLQNPKERLVLPKPTFRRIETFAAYEKSPGVGINFVDKALANVGFQESDMFIQPRTLMRSRKTALDDDVDFILLRTEVTSNSTVPGASVGFNPRVEYDMDEQDESWLEGINAERTAQGVDIIRPQYFEIAVTLIEKEWHALEKRIPKPPSKPPQTQRPRSSSAAAVNGEILSGLGEEQDSKCAICDDGDCENTNAIVFCDGCDLAVHQECYGVPFIPEGQWLCRKCQLIGQNTPDCIFCPNIEGAFKQTSTLRWSHLLCAIWIPEVSIGNQTFMEPVMDVEKVPKPRWKLYCYICQQRWGACIQCSNKNCFIAFHVTCARRCRLPLKMKPGSGEKFDRKELRALCDKHVPPEWRKEHDVDTATKEAKEYYRLNMDGKRWDETPLAAITGPDPKQAGGVEANPPEPARKPLAQRKISRLPCGAPIVPQIVFHNVESTLAKWQLRKRKEFVAEACKYWSLKRESRRGASLIKRLQLQLETFTSMEMTRRDFAAQGATGRPKLMERIKFATDLESDLAQVQMLCGRALEREQLKLKDAELLREMVDTIYFPVTPLLWPLLEKAQQMDANYHYFRKGLDHMQTKLEQRQYLSVSAFATDLGAVFHDAVYSSSAEDEVPVKSGNELNSSELRAKQIATQKDKTVRAKRIIKSILREAQDAAAKECELGPKSADEERALVHTILDSCMRPGPNSTDYSVAEEGHESDGEGEAGLVLRPIANNRQAPSDGVAHDKAPQDVEMAVDEISDEMIQGEIRDGLPNGTLDAAASSVPAETAMTLHVPNGDHANICANEQLELESNGMSGLPALSNSGSTIPSTTHPDPPTPHGDKDAAEGGVPWYLEGFEPAGTTVLDEAWPGREALRGISEELSELDDEALNDLVVSQQRERSAVGSGGEGLTVPELKRRARPKRKRF